MIDRIRTLAARDGLLRRIAGEPLFHFFAIGLALLAVDRLVSPQAADPRTIRLDEPVYAELVDLFAASNGRAPSEAEMDPLVRRHVMNETLYREARALGLDEGDEMIRERIMQKMRLMIQSGVAVAAPDDATLRAWFERNRDRYAEPALISLRLARVDGDETAARRWAQRLNAAEESGVALERSVDAPQVYPFADRPRAAMEAALGADFVAGVAAQEPGVWSAVETPLGWQAAVLDDLAPERAADFESVRTVVLADWREETFRAESRRALDAIIASYDVEQAPYDPAAFEGRAAEAQARADAAAAAQR